MTTIVYKEEMITSKSPISGTPRNVKTKTFTVQITGTEASQNRTGGGKSSQRQSRGGSPKPNKKFDVRSGRQSRSFQYDPNIFTITAYLPHEGGKRLKLQCVPGQSVQQVIESAEIPNLSHTGYQVYQFPSRALLNPEKDASVLQDQEISIEPMRVSSPDDVDDDRLSIVKELLRTEDTYLENLRNIFDIYMEPLKKWGLPQSDMNIMFRSLSRLCDVLMNFFSELELSVMHWNPSTTLIGGLFKQYRSFWEMYSEYSRSYAKACKLLKDKRGMDESFNRFLEMKRGAAMHTLESLMLLPVQRIYEYHKLLMRLYSLTAKEHPDHHDLRETVSCVGSMVQAREHQLNQNQNEIKLEQVQIRFPHDNLNLFQSLDTMESRGAKRSSKTYSSLSTPVRRPHHNWMSSPTLGSASLPQEDTDSSKNKARLYLSEGPVRIYTSGVHSHDRHLFLFDDLLIISKPIKQKSQHKLYKRKGQCRLSELWVTKCTDKSLESTLAPDTYFVIGWPFTNCVAAFSMPEEKTLWFNLLRKYIAAQRQKADPEKCSVQVLNFTMNPPNLIPSWITVHAQEDARSLLKRAIETMAIAVSEGHCQLLVKINKDEAVLLAGHEYPYGIQMYHNRHKIEYSDNKPSQLQFIVKRKETVTLSAPKPLHKKSGISLPWKRPKSKSKSKGRHRVYGAPLNLLIVNNELPELLQEMLVRLYAEAPTSRGIFRHSANHKRVRSHMESIDNRVHVNLYECSIHEVGALLKNILRNVPGGILLSSRYTEFVATNDFKDIPHRVQQIQKVINRLPGENQLFLTYLMPLLHHISKNHEVNGMNSINLAICFAPSLLWPSTGLDVIKNEVPPLIQFMIEQCPKIFGAELPVLYKQAILPASPGVEDMEFSINAPATKQFVPTKVNDGEYSQHSSHKRSDSIGSSMSEGSIAEDHTSSLLRARASGLTLSDSQLSQVPQVETYEHAMPRRNAKRGQFKASGHYVHGAETGGPTANITQSPVDQPSAKRPKKARIPERSSSLHGPNDVPYSRMRYVRARPANDPMVRRKSIAVQEPLQLRPFVPDVMPPSPNSSMSSSSHSYSPKVMRRIHHQSNQYYSPGYGRHDEATPSSHPVGQKKNSRKVTQYSHSFTSKDMERPSRTIPSSSSFYDRLLPLDATESKIRAERGYAAQIKLLGSEDEDLHEQRSVLTSTPASFATASSTHSVSGSSISTQTRPTGGSGGSLNRGSPDLLQREVDRGEFIKVAISERFKLNNSGGVDYPSVTPSYPQERIRVDVSEASPNREGFVSPGSESGQDSLERIQKKFQERRRLDSNGSESAFSKSSSYKGFLNTQQNKESLTSLTEESSFDDRPECDFHLGSLTRQRTLAAGDGDPNKLYTSNGYNSDTESAPSRTLSRPGKIKEVSSPVKTTMPSRYYIKSPQSATTTGKVILSSHQATPETYTHQAKHQPQQRTMTTQQKTLNQPQRKSELTTSLGSGYDKYRNAAESHPTPVITDPLVTTTRTITKSSSSSGSKFSRPRSGNSSGDSRVERLTEVYKAKEQEQVNANIEDVKVKLGLIAPIQRQRSKSTSENEAMKILHKIGAEQASSTKHAEEEEEEWVSKRKEWLSSAPTEDERKKARENYSKSQFQRMEYKSRSLRGSDGGNGSEKPTTVVTTKVTYTPEAKRKYSTMPDSPHVKTVKIRTYEIPEVQKIRRINLRTYY